MDNKISAKKPASLFWANVKKWKQLSPEEQSNRRAAFDKELKEKFKGKSRFESEQPELSEKAQLAFQRMVEHTISQQTKAQKREVQKLNRPVVNQILAIKKKDAA